MSQVFSHSRLASFESCPKKFQYRYILRIPAESESIEAFVGKRVHEVLERLYRAVARSQVPTLQQVLHRFGVLWDESFDPLRIRIARPERSARDYRSQGEQGLTGYYRSHYPFDGDETLAVEQRFRFQLDRGGEYRVQGVVDRLSRARDGALEIHDYKTSMRVPSQATLDRDRQLALYQLGVAQAYGDGSPVRLVWHYVTSGRTRTSVRAPEQLEQVREHSIRLIDRIRRETRFEPRPSPLCNWCEYAALCPASLTHRQSQAPEALPAAPPVEAPPLPAPAPLPLVATARRELPVGLARMAPRRRRSRPAAAEQLSLL